MYDGKFLDIQVDDNLQQLGFTRVSLFGKNIVVGMQGRNPVVSTFRKVEWERTAKSLEKKLIIEGIEPKSARQLVVFLTQEFLRSAEAERLSQESSFINPSKDTKRIIEEITKGQKHDR